MPSEPLGFHCCSSIRCNCAPVSSRIVTRLPNGCTACRSANVSAVSGLGNAGRCWRTPPGFMHAMRAPNSRAASSCTSARKRPSADSPLASSVRRICATPSRAIGRTAVIAQRPIARLGVAQIRRTLEANGESALGRFLADVQLEAAREFGARIACMNPGGVRQHLPALPKPDTALTFADLQAVHPFGNRVTILELTGAQLHLMLEQQWKPSGSEGMLSCSNGFAYRFDESRPIGARIVKDSIT